MTSSLSRGYAHLTSVCRLLHIICSCSQLVLAEVHLISKGETKVVNPGGRVLLECDFYKDTFNLFDNPILWRKTQLDEDTQLNMMGNLLEPFSSTKRFKVTFLQRPPRYTLGLNITDIRLEDVGNYTCEINGPQNKLLGFIVYVVLVRMSVHDITITGTGSNLTETGTSVGRLVFTEHHPGVIRCQATGHFPPSAITVFIGPRSVTADLVLTQAARMTGSRGLRVIEYVTARWSNNFYGQPGDDGTMLQCHVSVPGALPNTSQAEVVVNYGPVITCCSCSADLNDRSAFLRCTVRANPGLIGLYWILDVNGTIVKHGQVNGQYWTAVTDKGDNTLETTLYMYSVTSESFRVYRIVAENGVALKSQEVRLLKKLSPSQQPMVAETSTSVAKPNNNQRRSWYIGYNDAHQRPNRGSTPHEKRFSQFISFAAYLFEFYLGRVIVLGLFLEPT